MFRARMDSDDPVAGVALTAKGDLDPERPQGRLQVPQAAGERPGILGPAGSVPPNSVPEAIGAGPQQVGGAACPRAAVGHQLAHTQAATGSASMASSIAVVRLAAWARANVPAGHKAVSHAAAQSAKSAIRGSRSR